MRPTSENAGGGGGDCAISSIFKFSQFWQNSRENRIFSIAKIFSNCQDSVIQSNFSNLCESQRLLQFCDS